MTSSAIQRAPSQPSSCTSRRRRCCSSSSNWIAATFSAAWESGSLDWPQDFTLAANEHDAPPAFHTAGELGRGIFGFGAAAARMLGLEIVVLNAATRGEIDVAFETLARERIEALFVAPDVFFNIRRVQLATLAARYRIPTSYAVREFADVGGLLSYGASIFDAVRQVGVYTGRILKGEKPADLPVVQPSKFELVINAQTAKAIGLSVPDKLLVSADEVIE